jgi:hypothetical protein
MSVVAAEQAAITVSAFNTLGANNAVVNMAYFARSTFAVI